MKIVCPGHDLNGVDVLIKHIEGNSIKVAEIDVAPNVPVRFPDGTPGIYPGGEMREWVWWVHRSYLAPKE